MLNYQRVYHRYQMMCFDVLFGTFRSWDVRHPWDSGVVNVVALFLDGSSSELFEETMQLPSAHGWLENPL